MAYAMRVRVAMVSSLYFRKRLSSMMALLRRFTILMLVALLLVSLGAVASGDENEVVADAPAGPLTGYGDLSDDAGSVDNDGPKSQEATFGHNQTAVLDVDWRLALAQRGLEHVDEAQAQYANGIKHLVDTPTRDLVAAVEHLQQAADKGHAHAQSTLAFLHTVGLAGVQQNDAVAVLYHEFAGRGGSAPSRMALAYKFTRNQECEAGLPHAAAAAAAAMAAFTKPSPSPPLVEAVRLSRDSFAPDSDASKGHQGERDEAIAFLQHSAEQARFVNRNGGTSDGDVFSRCLLSPSLQGDAEAAHAMANLHYWGARGVTRDHARAARLYLQAAEAGDADAAVSLGEMNARGVGVPLNYSEARRLFESASKRHPGALNGLGYLYAYGRGVTRDYTKASLVVLLGCYSQQLLQHPVCCGVNKLVPQALQLFHQAAHNGSFDAMYNLGMMHYKGLGVLKDYRAAVEHFQRAATGRHLGAVYMLAKMHHTAQGVPRSCSVSMRLYKDVSERGPWGYLLRWAHERYMDGDGEAALLLYLRAAELGYEVAQSNAAWLLERGYGRDLGADSNLRIRLAQRLWRWAADQGNVQAILHVGDAHYYGEGTSVDYMRAVAAYQQAAQLNSAQAMFNLGSMQERGQGLPKDLELAKRYYDSALQANSEAYVPATVALTVLWLRMHGFDSTIDSLIRVARDAVDWGLKDSNAIVVSLVVALLTVMYLRHQRARQQRRLEAELPPRED
eukprot:jgi/Chlat1/9138/Chrsp97S08391